MRKLATTIGGHALALATRLERDERGATAIEYGLMAGIIAVGIIASLQAVGVQVNTLFASIVTAWPF